MACQKIKTVLFMQVFIFAVEQLCIIMAIRILKTLHTFAKSNNMYM